MKSSVCGGCLLAEYMHLQERIYKIVLIDPDGVPFTYADYMESPALLSTRSIS